MANVINTIGRRKTSVARVYMTTGSGQITINKRPLDQYFKIESLINLVKQPLEIVELVSNVDINANVDGGGFTGQADALKLAIARAIVEMDPELKPKLKEQDLMTRDSRMVERKKPGQKKARKKFQFSKR